MATNVILVTLTCQFIGFSLSSDRARLGEKIVARLLAKTRQTPVA
eukprot:SAG31_NODE_37377_length_304_cov_6.556098_1_plen_44_part_01